MKIAIFSDIFYPELSGISDSVIDSAIELVKLGNSVDFYVPYHPDKNFSIANLPVQELDLGERIKIHRFFSLKYPMPTKQGRVVIPTFLRWIGMRKNRPDIIHTHFFWGVGLEAAVASKFLHIPLIGTNHTPITEFLKYGPLQNKFIEKCAKRFVSWYYNHCDFVSAPNHSILEEMQANGFKKPCGVLSNPIDVRNFFPVSSEEEKEKIKKEFNLSEFIVLYTGRLATEKHIDVLIRAVALAKNKIPAIQLALTGHGDSEESLRKLAAELRLENNVKFFGTLPTDKHAAIYRAADVFAIASTAEMQSLSMMKAMATGLPVIGVNAWALPEYINENNGFILEPGDYQGIAEKIVFLYENPEKRKALGNGGWALAQKFSPSIVTREWQNIYEKVRTDYHKK